MQLICSNICQNLVIVNRIGKYFFKYEFTYGFEKIFFAYSIKMEP